MSLYKFVIVLVSIKYTERYSLINHIDLLKITAIYQLF